MISLLLSELGIEEEIIITRDIVNLCQQRAMDYYVELGKPIISHTNLSRRSSTVEFKQKVADLVGDEYIVLGEYTLALDDILMKHKRCGYEYNVRPNSFLNGRRCPNCAGKIRYTTEAYRKKLKSIVGDEFRVIGEYIDSKTKILMVHNSCGYEFMAKPSYFLKSHLCPKCSNRIYYTTDSFKEKLREICGEEYSLVGEYKPSAGKVTLRHNKCQNEYAVVPSSFFAGHRCPVCNRPKTYTTAEFRKKVLEVKRGHYDLVGEYASLKEKISVIHRDCGGVFEITPHYFINNECKCKLCGK